jgi:integrase
MADVPGCDTRTRYQGVFARHQECCAKSADPERKARCTCSPTFYGTAWDRELGRHRKTGRFAGAIEARNARADLQEQLRQGTLVQGTPMRLEEAREKFLASAAEGIVLNKWGRRYRRRAVEDLDSALRKIPDELLRRRLGSIRRGDVQAMVDELSAEPLSGSRIRSIVNALRSLYRWAQDRELVGHDPAARVRLPAMAAKPRDRVATPAEFATLLEAIGHETKTDREKRKQQGEKYKPRTPDIVLADTLPWALAAYATARRQEIQVLDWCDVDLTLGALELAADEEGRKPGGSWRVVPLVKPLLSLLRLAWIGSGRPAEGRVCPPRRASQSGVIALSTLQGQIHERWRELGLDPIGLHEARHTAATWLDHAGVSPKVASELMGHKTPEYQPGAASITLGTYTHTLPGELVRACDQLDVFLVERAEEEAASE